MITSAVHYLGLCALSGFMGMCIIWVHVHYLGLSSIPNITTEPPYKMHHYNTKSVRIWLGTRPVKTDAYICTLGCLGVLGCVTVPRVS